MTSVVEDSGGLMVVGYLPSPARQRELTA